MFDPIAEEGDEKEKDVDIQQRERRGGFQEINKRQMMEDGEY